MLTLYPRIKPFKQHALEVGHSHCLYVEECGNPQGIPVLFIHDGPGLGGDEHARRYFDPEAYRILIFDQRGAGRSIPHANLNHNTTDDLINDIETIRQHFGIQQWLLFGHAWGAALALLYSQTYPQHLTGLILQGTFLATQNNIDWQFSATGIGQIFPDYWQDLIRHNHTAEHTATARQLIEHFYRCLTSDNEIEQLSAAKAWARFKARCATLDPNPKLVKAASDPHQALAHARLECHYLKHNYFINPNQILEQTGRLSKIPCIIVHGRYDMISPVKNAWTLHQNWPDSQLHLIRDAGHSIKEPAIIDALIRATNTMALRLC